MTSIQHWLGLISILTCLISSLAFGDGGVKYEGRLDAGFKSQGSRNGASDLDAKIKIKSKREEGTQAVIQLRGTYEERSAFLQEGYIDHKFDDDSRLEFGLNKKRFGVEYELSEDEHPLLKRSILYRKLETFGYVGRELIVRYAGATDENGDDAPFTLSAGYSESLDTHISGHYQWNLGGDGVKLGTWGLVQNDRIDANYQVGWIHGWALWERQERQHWEFEVMGGTDPFETEFEKTFGDKKKILFYGLKGMLARRLGEGSLQDRCWEPLVLVSVAVHDSRQPDYNSIQGLLGVNYHFHKDFMLGLQLEAVGTNSQLNKKKRTYDDSRSVFLARFFF